MPIREKIEKELLLYKDIIPEVDKITIISIGKIDKKHDKTFKSILSNVKEMSKFLNQYLDIEIKEENLEKYKNSFITNQYRNKESDIIYKRKDAEIYYLIEHQSSIDLNMPNRILEYSIELIKEVRSGKTQRSCENPLIIPIVIYTGKNKWRIPTNFSDTQKADEKHKKYLLNLEYQLIDIGSYSKNELIKIGTKFSTMMLIEKCETSEEIKDILIYLIRKEDNVEMIDWIKEITTYILIDALEKDKLQEILNLIEERKNDNMDEEWIARVKRNDAKAKRDLKNKARVEVMMEVIKNMLNCNETDEKIMKYAEVNKNQLERIKKRLQMQN